MDAPDPPSPGRSLTDDYQAALDWWRLAGVDSEFADDATDWLAEPEPVEVATEQARPAKAVPPKPPVAPQVTSIRFGGEREQWPTALAEFQTWFVESPDVDGGGSYPRVPPRGNVSAGLMVIVPEPEQEDRDSLLSGADGKLLAGFLAAAGLTAEKVYFASALPRHTPLPEWAELKAAGLGDLLAHHIALAAPKRILAFGRNILPLLGHDTAQDSAVLREFNHDSTSVPLMGVPTLGELARSPGRRKRFWRQWLDWTE